MGLGGALRRRGRRPLVSSSREKVLSTSGVRAAGVDVGKVRVGVAVADELGLLAHPRAHLDGRDPRRAVEALAALAAAEKIELFDRFTGGAIPAGHASLAFHVVYRSKEKTLTDAEVDAQHAKVVLAAKTKFGATLRA